MAKRIIASISLGLIAIVIVATIIMASVKVNYGINCNEPDHVFVKYQSYASTEVEDSDLTKKIKEIIGNGSKASVLTTLFNGGFNKKAEVEDVSSSYQNIPTPSNFMVGYFYDQAQVLKEGKKDYQDANGNKYYYQGLWFTVNDVEGEQEVIVYIVPWYGTNAESHGQLVHQKRYKLSVDLTGLYKLLVDAKLDK